jgi:transcriptional regulator with XRE-family HTH domain
VNKTGIGKKNDRSGAKVVPPKKPMKARSPAADRAARSPGVKQLQIGARIRHARILAGVLMRELAMKVECTESMISKIESGRVVPSLPMLQRIVGALGRDFSSFFGSDPNSPGVIQRNGERPIATTDPIRNGVGVRYERLVPFGAGNLLEGNIHIVEPDGLKHDPITHQGETVGFVIEGKLELTIDKTTYRLNAGDSFFFKNHLTNSYRNTGPGPARILWVNTPQVH